MLLNLQCEIMNVISTVLVMVHSQHLI